MINWTEEDVEYLCMNILYPVLEETVKGIVAEQEKLDSITDRMINAIGDAIQDIRYNEYSTCNIPSRSAGWKVFCYQSVFYQ